MTRSDDNTVSLEPEMAVVPDDPVGTTVSRYAVLDTLGTGGMGRVLRAYDPKLQREVALKILRRHTLDEQVQLRLLREARAMAKLSHPNVVAVYDVEETRVGVVIVMELVGGPTLRQWLREKKRPWPDIVQCFRLAGAGLAAAHDAGLLHRDFKPGNVLVADGDVAKVTDFGLAKPASSGEGDDLSFSSPSAAESPTDTLTRSGTVMGTPKYMAPEQYAGGPLGPAIDQYAFCVALWEALCGTAPFAAGEGASLAAVKRKTAPRWPEDAPAVPSAILDALRRGLAPKPEGRWPTMQALLHALAHDPQRRRRRIWLAAGAVVTGTTIAAIGFAWAAAKRDQCSGAALQLGDAWDAPRREAVQTAMSGSEAAYARAAWDRVSTRLDRYADAWMAMHTDACAATTIRGEQSPHVLDLRMACLHRARLEFRAVTQVLAEGDPEVLPRADQLVAELRPLTRCAEVEALEIDVEPPLPEEEEVVQQVRAVLAEARAERGAGRYPAARAKLDTAREQLVDVEYGPVQTELLLEEGLLFDRMGDYDGADTALQQALAGATVWGQRDEMFGAANGLIYTVGHRKREAEAALRFRPLAEALAEGHVEDEVSVATHVAIVLAGMGANTEAEAEFRRALTMRMKRLAADDPQVASAHANLANVLNRLARYDEAEAEFRAALTIRERTLGPDHPDVAASLANLAILLHRMGRNDDAEATARRALALYVAALGHDHTDVAEARTQLGSALLGQGKHEEAEAEYRAALAIWEKKLGREHPHVVGAHNNLANALMSRGEYEAAVAEYRQALELSEAVHGAERPEVGLARLNLAGTLLMMERYADATQEAERAWAINDKPDAPPLCRATTAFVLAQASWAAGDASARRRARALAEEAQSVFREHEDERAQEVERWLAAH